MNVLVFLFSVLCVSSLCATNQRSLVGTVLEPLKAEHDEFKGDRFKICREYDYSSRVSLHFFKLYSKEALANATTVASSLIRDSIANLTSKLLHDHPELEDPEDVTEEHWDKLELEYQVLKNSTLHDLLTQISETPESLLGMFEEIERQSMPGGLCEIVPRAVHSSRTANTSLVKSVCDRIRLAFPELPAVPMPAHVWFSKWHRLAVGMISSNITDELHDTMWLLLGIQRFKIMKMFFGSKSSELSTRIFSQDVCRFSVQIGLEDVEVLTIVNAIEMYQREGVLLGPKKDWTLTDFIAYNSSRFANLNELRLLATRSSRVHTEKIQKVFDEILLRNSLSSFLLRKEVASIAYRKSRLAPRCEKRLAEITRQLAPVKKLVCAYVAMPAADLQKILNLNQNLTTRLEVDARTETGGKQCPSKHILPTVKEGERITRARQCTTFVKKTSQSGDYATQFEHCGIMDDELIWYFLLESRRFERKTCETSTLLVERLARNDWKRVVTMRVYFIRNWIDSLQSSVDVIPDRYVGRVECFYRKLESDLVKRYRKKLLDLIQTDESGFFESFKTDVRRAAALGKLSANETELIVGFVDESLAPPPQHYLPEQMPTLPELAIAYERYANFVDAFLKKCSSTLEVKDKADNISTRLAEIFTKKAKGVSLLDLFCEGSSSKYGTFD